MAIRDIIAENPMRGKGDWDLVEEPVLEEIRRQMAEAGLEFYRYLPNMFRFCAVVSNKEKTKWIHITSQDVRQGPEWMDAMGLRRMSGMRDVKDAPAFYCVFERLGEACAEYFGPEYDA